MFKVGDKVRCVEGYEHLTEGNIYTLAELYEPNKTWRLEGQLGWWAEHRFELVEGLDKYDQDMRSFYDRCMARHEQHKPVYGNKSFENSMLKTIEDMEEELLDMANYAAYQHSKLMRLKAALQSVAGLVQEKGE